MIRGRVLVVDTNVFTAYLMYDEDLPDDQSAMLEALDTAVAPILLWAEFRNTMITARRRQRIDDGQMKHALVGFDAMPIDYDTSPRGERIIDLALRHALTVYDALYLEPAQRRRLPLFTLDRALRDAARVEGVAA